MPPKARTAAHFPVVLRFFDDGGQELHATQLLHSTAKLSAPLRLFVGRFARHWHRGAPDAVDVEDLEASDAQGVLSLDVAIGNLLDPLIDASSQTLEIQLRRRRPCTAENDAARRIEATSTDGAAEAAERAPELRGYDLPPPNGILCSKGEFDDLLARAPENVVIVVSFEHCAAAEGKAAQAYHRLADRLWPKAVLVRSDLDDNEPLARACGVDRSPTLVFFKNRAALGKLFDANEMQINAKICKLLLNEADDPPVKARQHRDSWGEGLLKDR